MPGKIIGAICVAILLYTSVSLTVAIHSSRCAAGGPDAPPDCIQSGVQPDTAK